MLKAKAVNLYLQHLIWTDQTVCNILKLRILMKKKIPKRQDSHSCLSADSVVRLMSCCQVVQFFVSFSDYSSFNESYDTVKDLMK